MGHLGKPVQFVCDETRTDTLFVPPFEVRAGDLVKLQFPTGSAREIDQVLMAFRASGQIAAPEFPLCRSGILEFFRRQRTVEWLCDRTGMSPADGAARLEQVGVPSDAPLCSLAGTPRWLIGFLATTARKPDVIAFRTTGLDPLGTRKALQTVVNEQAEAAAIYLSTPDDWDWPEMEFTAVISVMPAQTARRTAG